MKYFLVVVLAFLCHSSQGQDILVARLTVNAGDFERQNTPVSIALDGIEYNADVAWSLREKNGKNHTEVAFQVEDGMNPRLWWVLEGTTPKGTRRIYELYSRDNIKEKSKQSDALFAKNDTSLILYTKSTPILQYNHAFTPPPKGIDKIYTRSGYIHPLRTPAGFTLTEIHPADHIHHMGIWNPWTKTKFEGREVDFWNLYKGEGTVEFAGYISHYHGPVFAGFKALHKHVDLTAPTYTGSKTALNEVWDVRLFNEGENYAIVDFVSVLNCATDSMIVLEEYRYAGFGFRANSFWTNKNSEVLTSEGKTRADADATRARWVNVSGATPDGRNAGIVFMSHSSNRAHPEPMRVWPVDANGGRGDMFFQFCPIRESDWPIYPGKEYVLKYRMFVYDGQVDKAQCERLWQDFAYPPKVAMVYKS